MYVHLTDQGRGLKKLLVPLAEETNNVSIEGIAPEDIKTTRTVLLAMIENLARDELQQEKVSLVRRKAMAADRDPLESAEKVKMTEKKKPGR